MMRIPSIGYFAGVNIARIMVDRISMGRTSAVVRRAGEREEVCDHGIRNSSMGLSPSFRGRRGRKTTSGWV